MRATSPLAALLAILLCAPAFAEDAPRRKRFTNPDEQVETPPADEEEAPAPKKPPKKKKHTLSIEGDEQPDAPPPKKPVVDEEPPPPPPRKAAPAGEDEAGEGGKTRSIDAYESAPEETEKTPRKIRHTAEEELGEDVPQQRPKKVENSLAFLDERGHGLLATLSSGALLLDSPFGSFFGAPRPTIGLNVAWQLGRLVAPEWDVFHRGLFLDLGYLYARSTEGTDTTQVVSNYHHLSLALLAGVPHGEAGADYEGLVYAKLGPALFLSPVTYAVGGGETPFFGATGGAVYGLGYQGQYALAPGDLGLVWRVDVSRYRRRYLNDLLLGASFGLSF